MMMLVRGGPWIRLLKKFEDFIPICGWESLFIYTFLFLKVGAKSALYWF